MKKMIKVVNHKRDMNNKEKTSENEDNQVGVLKKDSKKVPIR